MLARGEEEEKEEEDGEECDRREVVLCRRDLKLEINIFNSALTSLPSYSSSSWEQKKKSVGPLLCLQGGRLLLDRKQTMAEEKELGRDVFILRDRI